MPPNAAKRMLEIVAAPALRPAQTNVSIRQAASRVLSKELNGNCRGRWYPELTT
jgi:hypothetical protein